MFACCCLSVHVAVRRPSFIQLMLMSTFVYFSPCSSADVLPAAVTGHLRVLVCVCPSLHQLSSLFISAHVIGFFVFIVCAFRFLSTVTNSVNINIQPQLTRAKHFIYFARFFCSFVSTQLSSHVTCMLPLLWAGWPAIFARPQGG